MEKDRFCSLHWNTDLPISQTTFFRSIHLDFENLYSPWPEAWYLPSWSLIKFCNFCAQIAIHFAVVLFASRSWKSDNSEKCFQFLFSSSCKFKDVRNYRLPFFRLGRCRTFDIYRGCDDWETIFSDPSSVIPIFRIFGRPSIFLISFGNRTRFSQTLPVWVFKGIATSIVSGCWGQIT